MRVISDIMCQTIKSKKIIAKPYWGQFGFTFSPNKICQIPKKRPTVQNKKYTYT